MKTPSLLLTGCLVLWTGSLAGTAAPATLSPHADAASRPPVFECGGEPCAAVLRGLRAFLDKRKPGWSA